MDVEKTSSDDSATSLDIGAILVEARKNLKLSAQDIATQMNLTLSVIESIENNQFEQDIPLTFIRGYLRSYAQKVGVDIENICVEFDRQTGSSEPEIQKIKVVSDFKKTNKKKRKEINSSNLFFKLLTYLIVISSLSYAGWELWKRYSPELGQPDLGQNGLDVVNEIPLNAIVSGAESQSVEAAPVPQSPKDVDSSDLALSVVDSAESNGSAVDTREVEESVESAADNRQLFEPASQNTLTKDPQIGEQTSEEKLSESQLLTDEADVVGKDDATIQSAQIEKPILTEPVVSAQFSFTADCWVKITDANGEVIAIGLKPAGYQMNLEGVAPLTVVLGEPAAVSLIYQGESYDLSGYRAGRTAEFVLD